MSDVLTPALVRVPGRATSKDDAIREAGAVGPEYVDSMFEREKSVSTYMGSYLAIPHGTNEAKDSIARSALSVVRYDPPIDWDGNEVRFAVGVAGVDNGHLELLSRIALVFADPAEVDALVAAASADELYQLLATVNEGDA